MRVVENNKAVTSGTGWPSLSRETKVSGTNGATMIFPASLQLTTSGIVKYLIDF